MRDNGIGMTKEQISGSVRRIFDQRERYWPWYNGLIQSYSSHEGENKYYKRSWQGDGI